MKMKIIKSILSLRQKTPKRHKRLVKKCFSDQLVFGRVCQKSRYSWNGIKLQFFYIISIGHISRNTIFLTKMSLT